MPSTVLALVTQYCQETGLPVPSALVGATDPHSTQLLALLRKTVRECIRYRWPSLNKRVTWLSVAGGDQGEITTAFGPDFQAQVEATFWDETLRRPIYGPTPDAEWEVFKALTNPGPFYRYTVKLNRILVAPDMPAGHTLAVTYYSSYPVITETTLVRKAAITADTDTVVFSDDIMLGGLDWCWKKSKGEDWEADRILWVNSVYKAMGNIPGPTLRLDRPDPVIRPGIIVPAGNWMVP